MKIIKTISILSILFALILASSCGINNTSQTGSPKVRTNVNIVDPYGNKLFIEGRINNIEIKADKDGVYIPAKIEATNPRVEFSENLEIFRISSIDVEPGKSINILLEKTSDGIKLFRKANGNLMLYAFNVQDKPYFSIWIKNKLLSYTRFDINSKQMIMAGNWLIAVVPPVSGEIASVGEKNIIKEIPVPISGRPEIAANGIIFHNFK